MTTAASVAIQRRAAEKRRRPYLTAAKAALKKAHAELRQRYSDVAIEADVGNQHPLDVLQRGEPVTLKAYRHVSEGTHWLFDPDQLEIVGELTIKLSI